MPAAVAGFTAESLVAALYSVLRQLVEGRCFLDNCYPEVVRPGGNPAARRQLDATMDVVDANWRGIGVIPASGYALRPAHSPRMTRRSSIRRSTMPCASAPDEMPPGCDCARVVLGRIYPDQCALYGRACTPRTPIGPCMVSDEGACRIWWSSGVRTPRELTHAAIASVESTPDESAYCAQMDLGGRVQGVGFRPFVYRMAQRCGVHGWVRNHAGEVEIMAQGAPERLQRFGHALVTEAPPLARPEVLSESSGRA